MPAFDEAFANVLGTLSAMDARKKQAALEEKRQSLIEGEQTYQHSRDMPLGTLQKQWETTTAQLEEAQKKLKQEQQDDDYMNSILGEGWRGKFMIGALQGKGFADIFSGAGEMQGPPAPPDLGQNAATSQTVPVPVSQADVQSALFGYSPETGGFPSGFGSKALPQMQGPPAQDWNALLQAVQSGKIPAGIDPRSLINPNSGWPQPDFDPLGGAWAGAQEQMRQPFAGAGTGLGSSMYPPGFVPGGAWAPPSSGAPRQRTWEDITAEFQARQAQRQAAIQAYIEALQKH